VLVGERYYGAKLVRVKPEKPLLTVDVEVLVSEVKAPTGGRVGCALPGARAASSASSACLPCSSPPGYYTITKTELTNAIQLRTIPGVETYILFRGESYLYFDQKARHLWLSYDPNTGVCCFEPGTNWLSFGPKAAWCRNDVNTAPISNGGKKWVKVGVTFRYELWPAEGELPVHRYYEILTPAEFGGIAWGDDISCSLCGGKPTGHYAGYLCGTPTPIAIALRGTGDVEAWGTNVTVQTVYRSVTIPVNVWRKADQGEASEPIKIVISRIEWRAENLYVFDAGTNWKVVHFTWIPP